VETCKDSLTINQDLQSSVDWLTEVIHRFTDAYVKGNGPTTVNMDVLMHAEKVSIRIEYYRDSNLKFDSGRNMSRDIPIEHGLLKKWRHLRMEYLSTEPNFAQSGMKSVRALCQKW
jgi:hypothetical protein